MPFNFLSRHDSATSSISPTPSTRTPPLDIKALFNRNKELTIQSSLNQELFNQAHNELLNKQSETQGDKILISVLQDKLRQSDAAHACEVTSLTTEIQGLAKKLEHVGAVTAIREQTLRAEKKGLVEQVGDLREKDAWREKVMEEYRSQSADLAKYCTELEVGHNTTVSALHAELAVAHQAELSELQTKHNTQLAELQTAHHAEVENVTAGFKQKLQGKEETVKMLAKRTRLFKDKVEKAEAEAKAAKVELSKIEPAQFGVTRPEPELEFVSER